MESIVRAGKNWDRHEGNVFVIFGVHGYVDKSGKWVWPLFPGSPLESARAPEPVGEKVRTVIADLVAAGKEDKIDRIGVEPVMGLKLVLEGVITIDHLVAAEETHDSIVCTVRFNGVKRKIAILKNGVGGPAALDCKGNVL